MTAESNQAGILRRELVALMWRIADGDREAFAQLYERTRAKLFQVAMDVCQDRAAAEDVLAEVFVTVWKSAGAYQPRLGSPISWLAAITRNRAIDWWRRQVVTEILSSEIVETLRDPAPNSADHLIAAEEHKALSECLSQLPVATQIAIRAAFFEGLTYAQLADRAGVPLGTMKSWIRRGLAAMKSALAERS